MVSKANLRNDYAEFCKEYASIIYPSNDFLIEIINAARGLVYSFIVFFINNPNDFNSIRKHFLDLAINDLNNMKHMYLFFESIDHILNSNEYNWNKESIEEFKDEPCAKYTASDFVNKLNNINKINV